MKVVRRRVEKVTKENHVKRRRNVVIVVVVGICGEVSV